MPNLGSNIKSKPGKTAFLQELEMMLDPNISVDAKLMRLDALYDERFTKLQKLVD